jgi:hypothetical protein
MRKRTRPTKAEQTKNQRQKKAVAVIVSIMNE